MGLGPGSQSRENEPDPLQDRRIARPWPLICSCCHPPRAATVSAYRSGEGAALMKPKTEESDEI
jgi:hypothetical protein